MPPETQAALREARGDEAPTAVSQAVPVVGTGPVAIMDARFEMVSAFEAWRPKGMALVPAMREWCALYTETGAGVSAGTRAAIETVAWNTLQRWRNARSKGGSTALMRRGGGGRTSGIEADEQIHARVAAMLFANPHHVTAKHILRALAAEFPGRELPSVSTVRRFARRWRQEHENELLAVADPDGNRSRRMPAFGSLSDDIKALNECWELDSTRIDVMCVDGRRYALIAAIDIWSRRAQALVVPESRATAIGSLIRRCLLAWGVPERVKTDEGADYTSRHLCRVLEDLGIDHEILPPYSPDKKPFIERFIGTISHGLFTQLEGFTGHNIAQAKRLRDRKSCAARRGDDNRITYRCGLTAEQLQARVDDWCENVYGRDDHAGLGGISPFARAASWTGPRRTVEEHGLHALLAPAAGQDGIRVVGKSGIRVDGGVYIAGELGSHMGARVHVRQDPADYSRIFVFTEPDKTGHSTFICVAHDPVRTGLDRQAVATEAKRRWREGNKAARATARELEREHKPAAAIDAVLAKARDDAARVVALPPRGAPHRTGAMDAAARAEEAAQAADRRAQAEASDKPKPTLYQLFYGEN